MESVFNIKEFELMENFEKMRIFKGNIGSIKNKLKNESQMKVLSIHSVKEMSKISGKFKPIFDNFQSEHYQTIDKEIKVKIKLKKKWKKLDLFEGLEVIFIGQLETSMTKPFSYSFEIPSKDYKTSHTFNIMIVEPSM